MLEPVKIKYRKLPFGVKVNLTKIESNIFRNDINVNFDHVIESMYEWILSQPNITEDEEFDVDIYMDHDAQEAIARDLHLLPDSASDPSDPENSSPELGAADSTPKDDPENKKNTFARRLRRHLRCVILAKDNQDVSVLGPVFQSTFKKKVCLLRYYHALHIPLDTYKEWFIAV
ncbi:hypothetical protein V9T40_000997 [Parthenolecanium corni]|uniref:Uncharacterized protein n=1 Tax=Parthenolecanium corni TaxID=536013 RepID=A0AAN9TEF0_9HEMI